MRRVIVDTSCLIILSNINRIDLLQKLYGEIWIPEKVKAEFGEHLESWIKVKKVNNKEIFKVLSLYLDEGESEAIVLGIETKDALLVLDDIKARNIAKSLGIRITGTLGIILKAKEKNLIPFVKIVLSEMEKVSFRISEEIKKEILRIAKEK